MVTQNHQIISLHESHKMAERFSLDFEIRRFKNVKENSENQILRKYVDLAQCLDQLGGNQELQNQFSRLRKTTRRK